MGAEGFAADLRTIAEVLATCERVNKHDTPEEKEAWTLAHDFIDLEESFRNFLQEHLPRLRSGSLRPEEVCDLLGEMGEEFRHILYHIRNSKFYQYLDGGST